MDCSAAAVIWGVDIGSRRVAMVGLPMPSDADQNPQLVSMEVERSSRWQELTTLARQFAERVWIQDLVFIEEPPKVRNTRTFLALAQTSGALLAASAGPTYLVPVDTWKKDIIGHGGASKDVVANWLAEHHADLHQRADGSQDLVDAACIALYGQGISGAA